MNKGITDCKLGNDLKPMWGIGILSEFSVVMPNERPRDAIDQLNNKES